MQALRTGVLSVHFSTVVGTPRQELSVHNQRNPKDASVPVEAPQYTFTTSCRDEPIKACCFIEAAPETGGVERASVLSLCES